MRRGSAGRRGPGLLGTVGRTAVVVGTATAVSKGLSNSMNSAAQQQAALPQQQAAEEQQRLDSAVQQAPPPAAEAPPPAAEAPSPAAPTAAERIALLQQLAELKSQGILSEEEFAAEKARILAS